MKSSMKLLSIRFLKAVFFGKVFYIQDVIDACMFYTSVGFKYLLLSGRTFTPGERRKSVSSIDREYSEQQ